MMASFTRTSLLLATVCLVAPLYLPAQKKRIPTQSDLVYGTADAQQLTMDYCAPKGKGKYPILIIISWRRLYWWREPQWQRSVLRGLPGSRGLRGLCYQLPVGSEVSISLHGRDLAISCFRLIQPYLKPRRPSKRSQPMPNSRFEPSSGK
jgi:hypothetical protein